MTEPASPPAAADSPTAATGGNADFPTIFSPQSGIEVVSRLDAAARRGKLPGFSKGKDGSGKDGALFELTDFGAPFESVLSAHATPSGSGCELRFSMRFKPLMPWVFFSSLVLSVWPGVWLTDSMLRTYFSGYDVRTWIWYLPLSVPFVPLAMMQANKKSRVSARAEALVLIEKVRNLVGEPDTNSRPVQPTV